MKKKQAIRTALKNLSGQADESVNLAEMALKLAAVGLSPEDMKHYRKHLLLLSKSVREELRSKEIEQDNPTPEDMAMVLNNVLVDKFRYKGDEETYESLDNTNLMRVIDRRAGLPVTLGILYLHAARAQGWCAVGLSFPGHFLIRLENRDGRRVILDPFHSGRIVDAPELRDLLKLLEGQASELSAAHYQPANNRSILVRLLNNVKTRQLDKGHIEAALEALLNMQILAPENVNLWREGGLMYLRLGRLEDALHSLDLYITRAPEGPDRRRIDLVVQELKERIH